MQKTYPPPPPPIPPPPQLPEQNVKINLHGPETNFFKNIRSNLAVLERNLAAPFKGNLHKGLLVAFILSASMGTGLSLLLELALSFTGAAGLLILFPMIEEFFKGLSVFLVVWFMWKALPNRRYGALLGAVSGLGFAVVENIIYNIGSIGKTDAAEDIIGRWIGLPFMHVIWSAFVGVGVFVLLAQRKVSGTPVWLAIPFLLFGWVAHMCWNGLDIGLESSGVNLIVTILINIIIVALPFAIILRDFLGGHFNFFNFLSTSQELLLTSPLAVPPPPPPPPPP